MLIDNRQFAEALDAASNMTLEELRQEAQSGTSRSYYVHAHGRLLPMKSVVRLAYKRAGIEWDAPQSEAAARQLRPDFDIQHITAQTERVRLERQKEVVERWARPEQARFREELLVLYGGACVVTGCRVREAIDAAHIIGIDGDGPNTLENGLILRADLHRLFDRDLLAFHPKSGELRLSTTVREHYKDLQGKVIQFPIGGPCPKHFHPRWKRFKEGA